MILLPASVRVFVATTPMNLSRSFEGLANEVRCALGDDPLSGHVYAFINRRKNHVKMLVWTRGGFMILQKKLETGTFTFARALTADARRIEIGAHELAMLLEGIDASRVKLARRWVPTAPPLTARS